MTFLEIVYYILAFLSTWGLFLFFQRLLHGYRRKNTWKRDIFISLVQCAVVVLVVIPLVNYFV
ncbi:hypothetical protein [Evansella clarkii]|uniref:hypothetical protein n=1 Tax=Evansella clarkii TaxID=79879 RepID=UPI000B446FA7|nr:hypothetical protein [Evansella clarkii]